LKKAPVLSVLLCGARPCRILLALSLLSGCIRTDPPPPHVVSWESGDSAALAPMFRSSDVGPLHVQSVVYKPSILPLSGFIAKLSRGEIKPALASIHLKYNPSNTNDEALRLLIRRGYAPVFVMVTNNGDKPVDLNELALTLRDSSLKLLPIPNAALPQELETLDPKGLAANTYNVAAVVVVCAILIAAIIASAHGGGSPPDFSGAGGGPRAPYNHAPQLLNPVWVTSPVDYHGLLFPGGVVQAGGTAYGLLFYRVAGADWAGLKLIASYDSPSK
jgi:hypothetical protein